MHLAHELSGIVERKVVQYLRCNHEIESAGGEGGARANPATTA
jgi:hypothetical protein